MEISSQAKVKTEIINVELLPCSLGIQDLLLSTTIALFDALALACTAFCYGALLERGGICQWRSDV